MRHTMFFGNQYKMREVPMPAINAGIGQEKWSASGTFLNGGGYVRASTTGHKVYQFSWPPMSAEDARRFLDFSDGIYGPGPFYFADPFAMSTNMMNTLWSAPWLMQSQPKGEGSGTMLEGVKGNRVTTPANTKNLPPFGMQYPASSTAARRSFPIPVPPGHTLHLGVHGAGTPMQYSWTPAVPFVNLATNPSFEATSGTVEVRRNLASDPRATTNGTVAGQARWAPRWFGAGGSGSTTLVTGAADGPAIVTGARIPTYIRKTWTVGGSVGDTGFDHTVAASTNGLPVTAGQSYTLSSYMRASRNPGGGTGALLRMVFKDATGTSIAPGHWVTTPLVAGAWVRASLTATAPVGAVTVSLISDVSGVDSWQTGDTLDGTGLLVEQAGAVLPYFDGSTSPDSDLTASWTGTPSASPSVLTGASVAGITTWKCVAIRSTRWSKSGAYSMRLIPTGNPGDPVAQAYYFPAGGPRAGKTDTLLATVHLETPLLDGYGARMYLEGGVAPANTVNIANVAGDQDLRVTSPRSGPSTASFFTIPSARGNGDVWVDDTATIEGVYTGSGTTPGLATNAPMISTASATLTNVALDGGAVGGLVTLSLAASPATGSTAIYGIIAQVLPTGSPAPTGSWISGRGSSAVEFDGPPQVTGYSAPQGIDRQGVTATLREVGTWL